MTSDHHIPYGNTFVGRESTMSHSARRAFLVDLCSIGMTVSGTSALLLAASPCAAADDRQSTATLSELDKELGKNYKNALSNIDTALLATTDRALRRIAMYVGHAKNPNPHALSLAWSSIEPMALVLIDQLESSGIGKFIVQHSKQLRRFNYTASAKFREFEEKALKDLRIPDAGWDRIWGYVDKHKGRMLDLLDKSESVSKTLNPLVTQLFKMNYGPLEPLSPFNWSRAFRVVAGTVIGITNVVSTSVTGGFSIASVAAGVVSLGEAAYNAVP